MDFLRSKEATVILLLTAMTYTSAIAFEYGYAWVFKYPVELIYVDANSLFKSLIHILIYITLMVLTFFTPYPEKKEMLKDIISAFLTIAAMTIIVSIVTDDSKMRDILLIISITGAISYLLRFVFSKRKESKTYMIWSYILPSLALILFSFLIGMYQASVETEFFEFDKKNEKYAIIRIYNDKLIAKKINVETKDFYNETILFSLNELKEVEFIKVKKL